MWQVPDLRQLWTLGAAMLVFSSFGILAVGTLVELPIIAAAAALEMPLDQSLEILVYSSSIWAPIGVGMGMFVTSNLLKGLRTKPPKENA